jgi:hypothetical protein
VLILSLWSGVQRESSHVDASQAAAEEVVGLIQIVFHQVGTMQSELETRNRHACSRA